MHSQTTRLRSISQLLAITLLAACGGAVQTDATPEDIYGAAASELNIGGAASITRAGLSAKWAKRDQMPHGIAGAKDLVFITEPLVGRVVALDRITGREVGEVTPPQGEGFVLPFTLRAPRDGRLVVLDAGGFPDPFVPAIPRIYDVDYTWNAKTRKLSTQIVRTVRFDNLPVVYSEDFEILPDGTYIMSESVIGGLWVVHTDGTIQPGVVPSTEAPIPEIGACLLPPSTVGGIPFGGGFAPGVGSIAYRNGWLYFGSTCLGGLLRIPVATILDQTRTGEDKGGDVEVVSPGVSNGPLKGLVVDPWNPNSRWLWAADPFLLEFIRIDIHTGAREVVSNNAKLFNFGVAASFLPPRFHGQLPEIVVASDQEHRFTGINPSIEVDDFDLPFIITKILVNPLRD